MQIPVCLLVRQKNEHVTFCFWLVALQHYERCRKIQIDQEIALADVKFLYLGSGEVTRLPCSLPQP